VAGEQLYFQQAKEISMYSEPLTAVQPLKYGGAGNGGGGLPEDKLQLEPSNHWRDPICACLFYLHLGAVLFLSRSFSFPTLAAA